MEVLYRDGVVEDDGLLFNEVIADSGEMVKVRLAGEVICCRGVRLRVLKWMDVRRNEGGALEVLTVFYQYHAWRLRAGRKREQPLLRYDQAHGGEPHRHGYDRDGTEQPLEQLSLDTMPRLDAVIREATDLAVELWGDDP
jgi:hypothetical protein